ncbi:hypothetical protein D3C76_1278750 [compost metagenome]
MGGSRLYTGALRTCHRVAADEPGLLPVQTGRRFRYRAFGAAHIGDDAAGLQVEGLQLQQIFLQVAHRHTQEDKIRSLRRVPHGGGSRIHHLALQIFIHGGLAAGMPDNMEPRLAFEAQSQGAAHQSHSENSNFGHSGCLTSGISARVTSNAAIRPSFCSRLPTVIRIIVGKSSLCPPRIM